MAGYTDNERLKLVFKVQAANVIDAASDYLRSTQICQPIES